MAISSKHSAAKKKKDHKVECKKFGGVESGGSVGAELLTAYCTCKGSCRLLLVINQSKWTSAAAAAVFLFFNSPHRTLLTVTVSASAPLDSLN